MNCGCPAWSWDWGKTVKKISISYDNVMLEFNFQTTGLILRFEREALLFCCNWMLFVVQKQKTSHIKLKFIHVMSIYAEKNFQKTCNEVNSNFHELTGRFSLIIYTARHSNYVGRNNISGKRLHLWLTRYNCT